MTGIVNDLTSTFEIVRRLCGDKWKFLIICYLFNGPKRYGELQYHLDSIKPKVLTENLKELEDLGIIQRTSYEGNTLHVEYCLTHLSYSETVIKSGICHYNVFSAQKLQSFRVKSADSRNRVFDLLEEIPVHLSVAVSDLQFAGRKNAADRPLETDFRPSVHKRMRLAEAVKPGGVVRIHRRVPLLLQLPVAETHFFVK